METKLKKRIILVIIISIIILLIILASIKLFQKLDQLKREEARSGETYEYYEGKIFPSGIHKFKYLYNDYGGKLEQEILYTQLYKLCNYLPELYTDIKGKKDDEILEYYESNFQKIIESMGKIDKNTFLEYCIYFKDNITVDSLGKYKNSKIDVDSLRDETDYFVFDLTIGYTNFEKGIPLKGYLAKNYSSSLIYFEIK